MGLLTQFGDAKFMNIGGDKKIFFRELEFYGRDTVTVESWRRVP
jgi:hypothetical protein